MSLRLFTADDADRIDTLRFGVMQELDCEPVPESSGRREPAARRRKREKVSRTIDTFVEAMHSHDPPRSEDEVVARLTPLAAWAFSWLIGQLVMQVLKACWRRWNAPNRQGLSQCC